MGMPRNMAAEYAELAEEIDSVLAGEDDAVARMATVAAMLAGAFDHYSWTGFYRLPGLGAGGLVIGPYQGTLGCLRITLGQGVCGTAAEQRRTLVVDDVDAFPGHIACDSRSRSEIVVPVFDPTGALIAVLDVDSMQAAAFDGDDAHGLEEIVRRVFAG